MQNLIRYMGSVVYVHGIAMHSIQHSTAHTHTQTIRDMFALENQIIESNELLLLPPPLLLLRNEIEVADIIDL